MRSYAWRTQDGQNKLPMSDYFAESRFRNAPDQLCRSEGSLACCAPHIDAESFEDE
jgi:hypothetical protein